MSEESNLSPQPRLLTKNRILDALPEDEYERLLPDLEPVELLLGQFLYRAEDTIKHVYFLSDAMVSIVATTTAGQSAEIGVIGREGMIGLEVLMGSDSTVNDTLVQDSTGALRISTAAIRKEFKRGGVLHDSLLHFTRLLITQIGQTALCNRLHTIEERLSRWLLLCRDRSETNELQLTQEFLSMMLGANRATVTMSAIALQNAGYIKYSRGQITIIDGKGLEDFTCECYKIVKTEYARPPRY